jgi:hypothetical protein
MRARVRTGMSICLAAVVASTMTACSDTDRSGARFCGELSATIAELVGPLTTSDQIGDLVDRYESLDGITPLAIRDDWHVLTELLRTAENVDLDDPRSRQDLADAAYKAERSAREVARWVESTCGIDMPDVFGVEGPDTTVATTTPVTTTTPVANTPVAPESTAPTVAP